MTLMRFTPAIWFHDHDIGVFPIVTPGKTPACASWDDFRCSREQAGRFRNYGVRLGGLAVADSDKPETNVWAEANLPDTPFKVRTARGVHRYYRLHNPLPKFIHRDGHTIEFRNEGQYVVGPGSVHAGDSKAGIPPGTIYTPDDWSWRWDDLQYFPPNFPWDDRPPTARGSGDGCVVPEALFESERHYGLYRIIRSLVARGVPLDGALAACHIENRAKCRPPLANRNELDGYLRRAYHQSDTAGFIRTSATAWELFGGLCEIGLSTDAVMAACRSVDPTFDPNESPPEDVAESINGLSGLRGL